MKNGITDMLGVIATSFDGWLALWWVSIPLGVFFVASLVTLMRRRTRLMPASIALFVLAPTFTVVFAAMAVFLAADHESKTALEDSVLPVRALGALGLGALVTAGGCVFLAKNQRVVATSIALFGGWLVFWVFFVAAMSVSGTWL